MIRGSENIFGWFESSQMPYWRIYPNKGVQSGNVIMQSAMLEGQSAGDALNDLKAKIKVLNRGSFTLVAFPEPNKLPTKGYWYTDIEISNEPATTSFQTQVSGITEEQVTERIKSALDAYKREDEVKKMKEELTELKKQNKELEKATNDPINRIIAAISPHSDKIVAGIFPGGQPSIAAAGTANVAGHPDQVLDENTDTMEMQELTEEQQEVVSNFISEIAKHDANWPETLKLLTEAVQRKPALLSMVKNFI